MLKNKEYQDFNQIYIEGGRDPCLVSCKDTLENVNVSISIYFIYLPTNTDLSAQEMGQ